LSWAAFVSLDIDNLYGMISTSTHVTDDEMQLIGKQMNVVLAK